ncbi:aspartyl/asparaginyl beta-hydroxylase-like [Uloborus diversus]|uniref:aspartyl/asparaginyl beta-hydroxylase-like n=1 Tax=Uloborus diversus TaxID=327109 RepID=UPI00240A93F7|nr:aspartyl/asparaginyl beta-hydroxylase-like [Uloborus diversus]
MSDKEPRRRKKRKDNQRKVHFSDDIRTEDSTFTSGKPETRDSDQEAEEEIVAHIHQPPSSFAKITFMLIFSGLVISMSLVFISLQGADRGSVDLFDSGHVEEHEEILHELHEEEESSTETLEENLADLLPDLSNIFSLNTEQIEETRRDDSNIQAELETETPLSTESNTKVLNEDTSRRFDEEILEEYIERTEASEPENTHFEAFSQEEYYTESSDDFSVPDIEDSFTTSSQRVEQASTITPPEEELVESFVELSFTTESTSEELFTEASIEQPFTTTAESSYEEVFTEASVEQPFTTNSESSNEEVFTESTEQFAQSDFDDAPADRQDESAFSYEKFDVTNEEDFLIRDTLDDIDKYVEKSPENALKKCEDLLRLHPKSPRLYYARARALDKFAEMQRSNKHLEEAISAYQKVLSLENVPEKLYLLAGRKAAERLRFRGFMGKSLRQLIEMSDKFPLNVELRNQIAVGYLLIGQNKEAKKTLLEVLKLNPNSGFAKVHLGFILKTDENNYSEAIHLLQEGIDSNEEGVTDGRFYFHLGDALQRSGKPEEAFQVYERGVKKGLFLSAYQRSLYNVNSLTGKPWWNPYMTPYAPHFKILEKNWLDIKAEALALIDAKHSGFLPETEGLQDKGDWKQFELFARGQKIEKNCARAPKTCSLIAQMSDAATCKRGQAKFSIMHPGTHVWAHTGPTNCRLRSHLGLVIPDGPVIRVANETRKWEEGKVLLFDDSFEHEVWHNGSSYRLVLIVDFWHPELKPHQKRTLSPI